MANKENLKYKELSIRWGIHSSYILRNWSRAGKGKRADVVQWVLRVCLAGWKSSRDPLQNSLTLLYCPCKNGY